MARAGRNGQKWGTQLGSTGSKLLRVARQQCDETTAELAAIRVARTSTETALAQLDHQLLSEQRLAEQKRSITDSTEFMARFSERVRIKRANMLATLAQFDAREQSLNDDLSHAYAEIKKFERLIEMAERRDKKEQNRRQNQTSEDLVSARYGR